MANMKDVLRFDKWFSDSYMNIHNKLRRCGIMDEDNFHDTYLFVRKQVLFAPGGIADFEAYFFGCYRKAAKIRFREEGRYVYHEDDFFLRFNDEGTESGYEELTERECLVKDILGFIRKKFTYEDYRLFMLRYYEARCSYRVLAEYTGLSLSTVSRKVNKMTDTVRSNRSFTWRTYALFTGSYPMA